MSSTAGDTVRVAVQASQPRPRHLCVGGNADIRLGIVLLSPGGSGEADRRRYRLVAVLGGGRAVARAVGRGSGFSLGRSRHRTKWRSSRPRPERRPFGGRPISPGFGALAACFPDRLASGWPRHGRGSLRSSLCDARTPIRTWRTLSHHHAHTIWRFCEHSLLASLCIPRCPPWVARRMPGLCRFPACGRAAGVSCSSCRAKVRGARLCQRRRSRQRMRLRDLSRTEARSFFCWPPP